MPGGRSDGDAGSPLRPVDCNSVAELGGRVARVATIQPTDRDTTLHAAIHSVMERLDHIRTPRALCELRPNEDDCHWLCAWAAALSRRTVRWWLDPARAGAPLGSA